MAQYGRPNETISGSGWTPNGGPTQLWDCVDETPYSDSDYCRGTGAVTLELKFSGVADPQSSSGHVVRWRAKSNGSGAGEKWTVEIVQGSTVIATPYSNSPYSRSWTDYSYTLTAAEADAISDYSDLRLRITLTTIGSAETTDVSFMEFEFPDAQTPQLEIQDGTHATHGAESQSLTQHNLLEINPANHAHLSDNPDLVQHSSLQIGDATHGHQAEEPILVYHGTTTILIIVDATHTHLADSPSLTAHSPVLTIADATHAHGSESPTLTAYSPVLTIADAAHGHFAESLALVQHSALSVSDAAHTHLSEEPVLAYHTPGGVTLSIADAVHLHWANSPDLVQHNLLAILEAAHPHQADELALVYHSPGVGRMFYGTEKAMYEGLERKMDG